jgi:uncharacterized Zn finger protein
MTRENAQAKGRRYLTEARLTLTHLGDDDIRARCRGDGSVYQLGWNHADRWWCDCPATTDRCAHLVALCAW